MGARKSEARKGLEKQLQKIVKDLDEDGIAFLIEQANVLRYNMQVDAANRELQKSKKEPGTKKATSNKSVTTDPVSISIEADKDKKSFVLQVGVTRKFITRDELRHMVSISQVEEPEQTISNRMFAWLNKERRDILLDCKIKGKSDPVLVLVIEYLKQHYKVK
jgi:hypothetical protein